MSYFNPDAGLIAARFTIRFAMILAVASALNRLHDMQRYGRSLGLMFSKLPIGKRTISKIELTATLAVRMIPFIQRQFSLLILAAEARGEKSQNSLLGGFKRYRRLTLPLIIQSLRRADRTALALQARGYNPEVIRTSFRQSKITSSAIIYACLFMLLSVLSILT